MQRNIDRLKKESFDVLIIGGGITGACLAHDAALRRLKVALIEKRDFCESTSAASSKLIHCGIRYLPKGQLGKLMESAKERAIFQNIAPHLAQYVEFLIPTVAGDYRKGRGAAHIGMRIFQMMTKRYDCLIKDASKKIPQSRFIDRRMVLKQAPELGALPGFNGAYTLFESHMFSSERTVLAFLKSACQNGAVATNYLEAKKISRRNGRIVGIIAQDNLTSEGFDIRAKVTVNAAGPFIPALNAGVKLKLDKNIRAYSKGIHLVTRQINAKYAMAITTGQKTEGLVDRGGRHFFIIPWRGASLIGTTDVPFDGNLDHVRPNQRDIRDFMDVINDALPSVKLKIEDIRYAYAGLYPLNSKTIKHDTYQGTGEYQVVDHARKEGVEGIVSVLGAKFTTAMQLAKIGTDLVEMKLRGRKSGCRTASIPLFDGRIIDLNAFIQTQQTNYRHLLPPEMVTALIQSHGCAFEDVIALAKTNTDDLCPIIPTRRTVPAQIRYAVTHEMAQTLKDVMLRRTGMGTIGHPGKTATLHVAQIMQTCNGWNAARLESEIHAFNKMYHYR